MSVRIKEKYNYAHSLDVKDYEIIDSRDAMRRKRRVREYDICLFTFLGAQMRGYQAHTFIQRTRKKSQLESTHLLIFAWTPRITAYPHASSELSIIRNGRQIPTIIHRPRDIRPLVAYIRSNPFKKHLFTLRIFRTVLPTAN